MQRKVFKTGNSTVISLPKDYLEFLGLEQGAAVDLQLDEAGRRMILTPIQPPTEVDSVDAEFAQQVADFISQYRPALEALAKG